MKIHLIITPHLGKDGRKHPHLFDAYCDGELICVSSTPFFCAARSLIASGVASVDDTLVMRHAGASHDALRGNMGVAAGLSISEPNGKGRIRTIPYRQDARIWCSVDARIEQSDRDRPEGLACK